MWWFWGDGYTQYIDEKGEAMMSGDQCVIGKIGYRVPLNIEISFEQGTWFGKKVGCIFQGKISTGGFQTKMGEVEKVVYIVPAKLR